MTDVTDTGGSLSAVLAELGWRPETLVRRLNAFVATQGRAERLHEKTPYKWLRGRHPRSPWAVLTAALLAQELGRPITPADLGWPDGGVECVSALSGLVLPWTAVGSLRAVRVVTDAGGMDRRIFLTLMGSAVTAPAHEWLIARGAADLARTSGGSTLPIEIVDHLDDMTASLRRMDDQVGGGPLLGLVRDHLRYVSGLLERRRYSDQVGRRLHATAAELLRLGGWTAFDAGQHAQAQRQWVAALHAAHTAGDRALGANILCQMSWQATDLGQIREAITLAETVRAGYPGATPKVAAILDLVAASAHAYDGATTECRRAVDAAFDRLNDAGSSHGDPDWCYWLDEAEMHGEAGFAYFHLGDWSRARHHLRNALRLQDNSFSRDGAMRRIRLAHTYLRQDHPEVDQAVTIATHAVDTLTGDVNSVRCVGYLTPLVKDLAPYRRRPAVREFTDRAIHLLTAA